MYTGYGNWIFSGKKVKASLGYSHSLKGGKGNTTLLYVANILATEHLYLDIFKTLQIFCQKPKQTNKQKQKTYKLQVNNYSKSSILFSIFLSCLVLNKYLCFCLFKKFHRNFIFLVKETTFSSVLLFYV